MSAGLGVVTIQGRTKGFHVGNTFVATQASMAVCAYDMGHSHLHGIESILDDSRNILALEQRLQAQLAAKRASCLSERFRGQRLHSVCKGHTAVFEEMVG